MRIYFDENFSPHFVEGLSKIQSARRKDGIEVHSIINEFGRGTDDETWIPGVAQKHGVVITQDLNINRLRAQWRLCRENKVGVFFLKPPKKGWSYWDIVLYVVSLWPKISEIAHETDKPFGCVLEYPNKKIKRL